MATQRKTTKTAADVYAERTDQIRRLLGLFGEAMVEHARDAGKYPRSWGPVGDLGHVRGELINLVAFMRNEEPEDVERSLGA